MKTQRIFTVFAIFAAVILFSVGVSAAPLSVSVTGEPSQVGHNAGSLTFQINVTNTGTAESSVQLSNTKTAGSADYTIVFSDNNFAMADGSTTPQTRIITAVVTFAANQNGQIAGTINADGASDTFSIPITNANGLDITTTRTISANRNGTIQLRNTGNADLFLSLTSTGDIAVDFYDDSNKISTLSLPAGTTRELAAVATDDLSQLEFGNKQITVTASDSAKGISDSATISFFKSFCEVGDVGSDLQIRNIDIANVDGDDDEVWAPFDNVEIEVEIENNGNENVDDVVVEIGLFDSSGNNIIDDFEFSSRGDEKFEIGRIRDDERETALFQFEVPGDLEEGDYDLVVKAYSDDLGEDELCVSESNDLGEDDGRSERIEIERETDSGRFIQFRNIDLVPAQAMCGDRVSLSFDVVNVGDEDQEDQIRVSVVNQALGISQSQVLRGDLDQGDRKRATIEFVIPENAEDGQFDLAISAEYDYDSDDNDYGEISEEPEMVLLRVAGCDAQPPTGGRIATISAALDSDARSGEQLVVRSTVTNLLNQPANFVISASGYESWAELDSISSRMVTLNPGQSTEVTLQFAVDENISGRQSFVIEARANDQTETRTIEVNIEGAEEEPSLPRFNLSGNALIWVIGAINLILVILIIVVAIRIARR